MPENVRIQFDVSPQRLAELEELMRDCGLTKKTDLVNNALVLLKWAVKTVKSGRTIASVDERNGKYRDFDMPVLSYAASTELKKEVAVFE